MKSSRFVFQLAPSVRRTGEIGSGLLPTARAHDGDKGVRTPQGYRNEWDRKGNGADLPTILAMLPTPTAGDAKGREYTRSQSSGKENAMLPGIIGKSNGLKLQPAFVGWMMGFPEDWTVSPFRSGDANP